MPSGYTDCGCEKCEEANEMEVVVMGWKWLIEPAKLEAWMDGLTTNRGSRGRARKQTGGGGSAMSYVIIKLLQGIICTWA